jgi:hypothetical protein
VGVAYPRISRHQPSGQKHEELPGARTIALIPVRLLGAGQEGSFGEKGNIGRYGCPHTEKCAANHSVNSLVGTSNMLPLYENDSGRAIRR